MRCETNRTFREPSDACMLSFRGGNPLALAHSYQPCAQSCLPPQATRSPVSRALPLGAAGQPSTCGRSGHASLGRMPSRTPSMWPPASAASPQKLLCPSLTPNGSGSCAPARESCRPWQSPVAVGRACQHPPPPQVPSWHHPSSAHRSRPPRPQPWPSLRPRPW